MNTMRVLRLCMFFVLSQNFLYSQTAPCSIQYLIDAGDSMPLYIRIDAPLDKADTIHIIENTYFVCILQNCKGQMEFKSYYKGSLRIVGKYVNAIDTSWGVFILEDPLNPGHSIIQMENYFQPLKNGEWDYYDASGIIEKREFWNNGIFLK